MASLQKKDTVSESGSSGSDRFKRPGKADRGAAKACADKKEQVRVAKTVNSWVPAAVVSVEDKRTILNVHFAMTEELDVYARQTHTGFRVKSVSPNGYDHAKSALDRIAVAHFLTNGLNDEVQEPAGFVIAELHGLKYRNKVKNFETNNRVLTFGGVKSQYASINQITEECGFGRPKYVIGFNFYDFVPTIENWRKIAGVVDASAMRLGLFAFVPTQFVMETDPLHEITGSHVDGGVIVKVANTHYRDSDNTWASSPGVQVVDDFVIEYQTLPEKFGSFRVLEVRLVEKGGEPRKIETSAVVAVESLLNGGKGLSGSLVGVSLNIATSATIQDGVVTVDSPTQGFVNIKADFLGKITRKALSIRELGSDAARLQLERFACSTGEASAAQIVVAVALARVAAAKLSIAGSIMANGKESQDLFDLAYKARISQVELAAIVKQGFSMAHFRAFVFVLGLFWACYSHWGFVSLMCLAFAPEQMLKVLGVVGIIACCCWLAVTIEPEPVVVRAGNGLRYDFKEVGADYRVIQKNEGFEPIEPQTPQPNSEYIQSDGFERVSPNNAKYLSRAASRCLYWGVECEKRVDGELRQGTTIKQVRDAKQAPLSPAIAFTGIQVATEPHVYAVSTSNEERVLRLRAFARKGAVNDVAMHKFASWVNLNFLSIFNLVTEYVVVADDEAWFAGLENKKAELYSKHDANRVTLTKGELQRDSFTKMEAVMKDHREKPGRLVQGASASVNRLVGPWVNRFSTLLHILWHHKHRVFFNGSVDAESEGNRFEQLVAGGNRWADGDFSGFDSTQSREMFNVLHGVYERFGAPPHVMAILRAQVSKIGFTRAGFRYTADGTRASGDQDTLVGNGIINSLTNLWAWCEANGALSAPVEPFTKEELDEAMYLYAARSTRTVDLFIPENADFVGVMADVKAAVVKPSVDSLDELLTRLGRGGEVEHSDFYIEHCGDDNLMFYNPLKSLDKQASLICELGMVNNIKHAEHPEICSSLFWPTEINGRKAFVLSAKPGRLAVKLGFITKPMGKLVLTELASKIYGTLVDCHHVPFLGPLLIKYLELIPDGVEIKALYHKYKAHAREKYPVTEDGILMFCERYGVTRAEYDDLVWGISTIKSLPWVYRHPVFDRLYEIDNDLEF